MTDQQREKRIKCMARLVERYMQRNQWGHAKRSFERMRQLIRGRSVQQVMKMERERGLI